MLRIRLSECEDDPVNTLIKLWLHESALVYQCRCARPEDKSFVQDLLHRLSQQKLGSQQAFDNVFGSDDTPLVFSEFVTVANSGVKSASHNHKDCKPYEVLTSMHLHYSCTDPVVCHVPWHRSS